MFPLTRHRLHFSCDTKCQGESGVHAIGPQVTEVTDMKAGTLTGVKEDFHTVTISDI